VANCVDMKKGDVFICDACGLEIEVVKECSCGQEEEDACSRPMECCGQTMRLK